MSLHPSIPGCLTKIVKNEVFSIIFEKSVKNSEYDETLLSGSVAENRSSCEVVKVNEP